ncbi:hypothetical protein [Tsukamurella tyrosinosolvens]|uniref:hypothetical protein n=1 Tax=Tsukamurella tyrosinosolvens TaxID=57704 RepID=UPI00125FCE1B
MRQLPGNAELSWFVFGAVSTFVLHPLVPPVGATDKRGFTTKREAEAFAATVEVEQLRGEYLPPALAGSRSPS